MNKIKNLATVTMMMVVFSLGVTNVRAGLLVSDFNGGEQNVCTEKSETRIDKGILVTFTGILVTFTGILVTLADSDKECAVIIHD